MRDLTELNRYRRTDASVLEHWGWVGDGTCGAFMVPSPIDHAPLVVVASAGMEGTPWDHVSVSRKNRCPNWAEMAHIATLFFRDDETAMQLHVPASDHVNNHPNCLHWWRPTDREIPRPDALLVGVKDAGLLTPTIARQLHDLVQRKT